MCGRFVVANVASQLVGVLRVDLESDTLPPPSYNIAPTSNVAIVLDSAKTDPPTRRLTPARWGLVPGWAKDVSIGARAFNARAETLAEKPMFRAAFEKRRAVVPMTGYYEWQTRADGKSPYFVHPDDGAPLFVGGLYEWWKDPARSADEPARWVLSFTIVTQPATAALAPIHDRMPLFLDPDFADAWLDTEAENIEDVLDAACDAASATVDALAIRPVSQAVGNVRNNSPELIVEEQR